jgi:polysaccharide export outer membrane protein
MLTLAVAGCATTKKSELAAEPESQDQYLIGPGDTLRIFVWRNPEISVTVPVRPDGKISTPLVEDIQAVGKTPTQLARDMETQLATYIKSPQVNVIVTEFVGTFGEQIRVVGKATEPRALSFRRNMTLLDVMIEVGGLAPGAAGNRARVRIDDLINRGKIAANVRMMPGDVLIIPESLL